MPIPTAYLTWAAIALLAASTAYGLTRSQPRARRGGSGALSNGHLLTRRDHQARVPRVYGRCRIGVNTVFMASTSSDNKYLHIVATLCEGPIKGVVRQDGTTYETTATIMPQTNPPLVYLDNKIWTSFPASYKHIEFFNGSATQNVCSTLQTLYPSWKDALRNTAYLYIILKYDRSRYMIDPGSITCVIDALECYDPITTTTVWTDNPAICAYNYMTTSGFRGGMGIPTTAIDTTSLSDFKDYCNTKGWTANIPINEEKPDADNLQAILEGGRGRIINPGGTHKFRFFDLNHESTVMNLTAEDITVDDDGTEQIQFSQPDVMDRANTVRCKYLNGQDYLYSIDDYVLADDDAIADDGGDRREIEVNVHGLSDINLVQQMANYHLERARYNRTLSGIFGRRCVGLEPMDLVTLTFAPFGWNQKYFRVMGVEHRMDFTVALTMVEEALALYDDTYDPGQIDWFDTTLPDPFLTPLSVINVTTTEEVYIERNRSRSRIEIDFDPPAVTDDTFWGYAEVWVRRGISGTWEFKTKAGENNSNSNYTIDPAQEGETYFIRLVSVSIHGEKEEFDLAYTAQHYVSGYSGTPANITTLSAASAGSTVNLAANYTGTGDVQAFEIRQGTSWDDGIVVKTAAAHSNALRVSLHSVRPGTLTFWAAAMDNAGNYSSTPVSASVTVFIPAGYTQLATYGSWTHQTNSGSYSNMTSTTHTFAGSSEDALRVSQHYKNPFSPYNWILTGNWQSTTHDLGAVEKVRIWGDFVTDLDTTTDAWNDNFVASTSWDELGLSGSWASNFSVEQGGKLEAKLLVKDTDSDWGNPDAEYEFFQYQAIEVEARYVRVDVTITDPNQSSYLYLKELEMKAYEGPA